jgi:hypothetical protein
MKREREREYLYKYKREERKQFQSVAYFSVSCFSSTSSFALIFFRERICSHKQQQQRTTTPILIEQTLFAS